MKKIKGRIYVEALEFLRASTRDSRLSFGKDQSRKVEDLVPVLKERKE